MNTNMAAFFRAMRPHIKPLGSNCAVYGVLYGGAEFTQQAKGIYVDVRFFLNNELIKHYYSCFSLIFIIFFLIQSGTIVI